MHTLIQPERAENGRLLLDFADNRLLVLLFGEHDRNLSRLEAALGVRIANRGNRLTIEGDAGACAAARDVLLDLYARLEAGEHVDSGDFDGALRMAMPAAAAGEAGRLPAVHGPAIARDEGLRIATRKRVIQPRSPMQAHYVRSMRNHELTFGVGPAGTGKTYLAVAMAVEKLLAGEVERIILTRPAVEAGENLGFLPGDLKEKVDPYVRPLYDALHDMLPAEQVEKRLLSGQIEVAPLAYMRGRTLVHAWIILDEAQNATAMQMKMFLTRFGEGSRMTICGDPSQVDLPAAVRSGLADALTVLEGVEGVAVTHFSDRDVVRHPLVARIVQAYDRQSDVPGGQG